MGIWGCLGQNLDEVRGSLFAGKSGIGVDPVLQDIFLGIYANPIESKN